MSDINAIFQEYLSANADKEPIDFDPFLQKYPQHKESLSKKIRAYQKLIGTFRDEQPEKEVPLLVGREIGGCKLLKVLGQGGMGVVYLGRQEKLGRDVVVKVLRPFAVDNQALKERFLRESRIIGRLNHKNIVPVYDVGEQDGSFYIIMRYVEGTPLNVLIEKFSKTDRSANKFKEILGLEIKTPTEFLCNLIIQIADAVQYAHDNGVIHRDIKPSNIIVEINGNPMLLDFGLSHDDVEKNLTVSGEFLGTPIYSAPESFQKQATKDSSQLDIYSLGVTLYELLTGGLPYEGDSIYEIYTNIKNKEPIRPKIKWKHIPRDLETIISTAIAKDPQLRYQSMQLFRDDLQNFLNYLPIKAKSPSLIRRTFYFARRKKGTVIAISCVLFLAVGVGGGLFFRQKIKMSKLATDMWTTIYGGDIDEGIAKLKSLITLYPKESGLWQSLGTLQSMAGNYDEAIKSLKKRLSIEQDLDALDSLVFANLAVGDVKSAEMYLSQALKENPDNNEILENKAFFDVENGDLLSAIQDYKKLATIEVKGFVDEWAQIDQYDAFIYPNLGALAVLYKDLGYQNIAKKHIWSALHNQPFNTILYKISEWLPLKKIQRDYLSDVIKQFGQDTLEVRDGELSLVLPFGWQRQPFQRRFGKEVLAVYSGVPVRAKDFFIFPGIMGGGILVAHMENSKNILNDVYQFLDRLIVQYNGGIISRTVKKDGEKILITSDVSFPTKSLKIKTLVLSKNGNAYYVLGVAPIETFENYAKHIEATLNSVHFGVILKKQQYQPPYKSYSVWMPRVPYFWQKLDDKTIVNVLGDDVFSILSPRYYVYHVLMGKYLNDIEISAGFMEIRKWLESKGKLVFVNEVKENDNRILKMRINSNGKIIDINAFFIGTNGYLMEVDQDQATHDEMKSTMFFNSFTYFRDPMPIKDFLFSDKSTPQQTKKSTDVLANEAMDGNPKSQNEIGKFYLNLNPRTEQDLAEAMEWFKKSADQNYPNAINNIGVMFENGLGVQKDKNEAMKWYRRATDLGFDIAQNNLGVLHLTDAKTPEDFAEILKLFLSATQNGNKNAAYNLGQIYEDGAPGISINYKEADYWYGKAFE